MHDLKFNIMLIVDGAILFMHFVKL